jgi:hypothetical protein
MSERSWFAAAPFVLAIGLGSALLFVIQPMCARMVLPYLGGSPGVWTTCMLFFQAGLLAGYLNAHASGRMGVRKHAAFHLVLLGCAAIFLPPFIGRPAELENTESPVFWLLASLVAAVGLPYLVLASSAPLLQVWFARSAPETRADPYFLYAASNAGSLVGLLAYLFVLEPLIGIRLQSYVWSGCFGLFVVLTTICAAIFWKQETPERNQAPTKSSRGSKAKKVASIPRATIARWLFLAFVPSSLLLSVTVHLTADVASLPFLWVVPLGLYLMTYVLAFSARGSGKQGFWTQRLPVAVLVVALVLLSEGTEPLLLIIILHLLGLFWIGMAGHGELARSRPPVEQLTSFYLCIAVGGALGGVFNALLAPAIFNRLAEYPVALVLACFIPAIATPRAEQAGSSPGQRTRDFLLPALLALLVCGLIFVDRRVGLPPGPSSSGLIFGLPLVICYTFSGRPIRFGLGIAALFLGGSLYPGVYGEADRRVRSFFGVHRVTRDAQHRTLVHGNTVHGLQSLDPARRREPLAYYTPSGPVGELLRALSKGDPRLKSVAVLGLGAGALAAYARPGQTWTFYEIDPAVVQIARQDFTYLRDATSRGARIEVVPGDARLQINRARDQYGLIILDAFSSDSIPTHLFTSEAFAIYRDRLSENGILAIHYSSRYFDLRPVLGSLANAVGAPAAAIYREDLWITDEDKRAGKAPSKWAIFLQTASEPVMPVLAGAGWLLIETNGSAPAWTDDHANILGALRILSE